MTFEETAGILYMLSAYYGEGKADAKTMAYAWLAILEPYDFGLVQEAIIEYAKNDTRDYASFPTAGNIIAAIKAQIGIRNGIVNSAINRVEYSELSDKYKEYIDEQKYGMLLSKEPEEITNNRKTCIEWLLPKANMNVLPSL